MPGFTPGRRFQPAYRGFSRVSLAERAIAFVERQVKGPLFGCRMCGNCLLQETAFICPMECPKGLRNGPCGGSTPERCYVDESRPCIWHRIYARAERLGREDRLMEVLPPLDWARVGKETWLEVLSKAMDRGAGKALASLVRGRDARREFWGPLFHEIRQPFWWQGDDRPHPPPVHQPVSTLEDKLAAGAFVVTSEVAPPLSVAPDELARTLAILRDYIDAANFTDNPSATPRMSSLACAALSIQQGVEPVMQLAARDRSRMALQADVLGAAALGIRNILCLTGDHPRQGPGPQGRMDIWDVDSIQLLWTLRRMRDTRQYLDGRSIPNPPRLFLGAAASPSASTPRAQALRELKKAHAGAQFFQSNLVYDVDRFEQYLEGLDKAGVLAHAPFLVGITPVRSARAARMMTQVPGIVIPPSLIARLEASSDPQEEGVQIALEIVDRVKRLPGVRGVHIMAVGWELIVPRLVRESGIRTLPATAEPAQTALTVRTRSGSRGRAALVPPSEFTQRGYLDAMADRVLVFDGAMGTEVQKRGLGASDYGGERQAGCNDILVIERPEVIESVHASYLEAGADVIETCTFRANRLTMGEFGLEERVREINHAAATLARRVADRYARDGHRRFVAGVLGPTGKLPSSSDPELSRISFQELSDVFAEQAEALLDGDCDLLLIETSQDLLEVKAAIMGVQDAFARTGRKVPVQAQVTLDTNGRMLLGTDTAAVLAALERMPVDVLGLNCSTGPEHMRGALAYLGDHSSKPISCLPNAGLPINVDGQAVYPLQPADFARELGDFVERFGLNAVGGCCGTTPDHIRLLVDRLGGRRPQRKAKRPLPLVSSGMTAASLVQNPRPLLIGERLNAQGSKRMKELLLSEDYDGISGLAREQIDGGAHTLDICVAMTERRDETYLMAQVVKKLSQTVEAPLVIDTTEADVLEVALEAAPGRVIVNAVNMENGRQRLDAMLPLIRDYGAATIALTIDEQGMARSADRKLAIARRLYDIATGEYGLLPDALIFDPLTFTLATGDPESASTAVETLEGLRRIKAELPGVLTSLGVSNVSYGFKPAARAVLNSVFLYHAVEAGLDMAIVNPKQVTPYAEIPGGQRDLAEDLLFNRRPDATARFIAFFEGVRTRQAAGADPMAGMPPAERLHWRILHRQPEGCEADLDALVAAGVREATGIANLFAQPGYTFPNPETSEVAVRVLNQVLLPAMKEVGDKFGSGELILPFVLQSAETMKKAVSHLERYLERAEGASKGRVVLATVYGDVHDIGKNLIKTILANNGYTVHDLGKQVPVSTIVDRAAELRADVIGLSALLVSTSRQMPLVVRELDRRGLSVPVMVGGAAINRDFGRDIAAVDGDRAYPGGVFYCRDAFEGLDTVDRLMDPAAREALVNRERKATADRRTHAAVKATVGGRSSVVARVADVPTPPFWGSRVLGPLPLDEVFARLNESRLFRISWGAANQRGADWKTLQKAFSARLERMKRQAIEERWLVPQAVYGYFPVQASGNDLVVFHPDRHGEPLLRLAFPRQAGGERLCLADYFLPEGSEQVDIAALQVVTVGAGATALFDAMDAKDAYSEAYFSHGLAVRTAEAATEWLCDRIRGELGLTGRRGVRYAWGFGALPDVEEHRKVFQLLPAEQELGMSLTSAGQLIPEQSTATLVVHHPEAKYFNTEG